jgi:hypothetical protein
MSHVSRQENAMKRLALLVCGIFALSSAAHAAGKCGWLASSKLDEAFPEYAPWQVMVGGNVGNCTFNSNPHAAPNIFGAIQSVKATPAEAEELARTLRDNSGDVAVQPAPALGKYAFTYQSKDASGKTDERSLFFVAHRGKVEVNGSLVLQRPIGAPERAAAEKLIQAALAISDDARALHAANKCPYFDATLIRRLLPDKDYEENVYGENSCMAQAHSKAVILSIVADARAEQLAATMNGMAGSCTSEDLPGLGKSGKLTYKCSDGAPRATVRFTTPGKMFEFSFAPEREPTSAERAVLVQLAQKAAAW